MLEGTSSSSHPALFPFLFPSLISLPYVDGGEGKETVQAGLGPQRGGGRVFVDAAHRHAVVTWEGGREGRREEGGDVTEGEDRIAKTRTPASTRLCPSPPGLPRLCSHPYTLIPYHSTGM